MIRALEDGGASLYTVTSHTQVKSKIAHYIQSKCEQIPTLEK